MPATPRFHSAKLGHLVVTVLFSVVALYGCFLVINDLIGIAREGDALINSLTITAQISPEVVALPEGIQLDGSVIATLQVEETSSTQMTIALARDASNAGYYLALLWLLRGIAGSIRHNEPFRDGGVRRLRAIGLLLLVGAPALQAINTGLETLLFRQLPASQTLGLSSAPFSFPEGAVLAGLGAVILAQVFALGGQLSQDVEATI